MTNTELLKQSIKDSGYKYSFIAKTLGITPVALNLKINNKSRFAVDEMYKLSDLLGITNQAEYFFAHDVNKTST